MQKAQGKLSLIRAMLKDRSDRFYILDLENKSIEVLDYPELRQITNSGFCWVNDSTYFICGGSANGQESEQGSAKAFTLDIVSKKLTELPQMNTVKFECLPVHENGLIYVVGIYGPFDKYKLAIEVFNLQTNSWSLLSDTPFRTNGLKRTFKYKNELVIVSFRQSVQTFNLDTKQFNDFEDFVYEFDDIYLTQTGRCITTNGYHNAVCEYIYSEDQICTINTFDPFPKTNHTFYLPELDAVVFYDDYHQEAYGIYYNQTNESQSFGKEDAKFLQNIKRITGAQAGSMVSKKMTDSFISVDGVPFDQRAYMFGLWHIPFVLNINFKDGEESVKIERIPESLFLKFNQGVEILDDSRLIFAGGNADDYSVFASQDVMIYDVDTKQLTNCNDLKSDNEGVLLKKIDLKAFEFMQEKIGFINDLMGKKPKPITLSDAGVYDVFLINSQDEFEVWNSQTSDWNLLPKSGSQDFPTFLDLNDRIIVFESTFRRDKEPIWLSLREYDFKSKSFKLLYNKKSDFRLTQLFCLKLEEDTFLVVVDSEKNERFAKMTLTWNDGLISDIDFEMLDFLDEKEIKGEQLRYFVMGRQVFVIVVTHDWGIKYRCFDLDELIFIDSPKANKIGQLIDGAFESIGIRNNKWRIKDLALVYKK